MAKDKPGERTILIGGAGFTAKLVRLTLQDLKGLCHNPLNDRDLTADTPAVRNTMDSFRRDGFNPVIDPLNVEPLTGQTKPMLLCRKGEGDDARRMLIIRGHVRSTALNLMASEDAELALAKADSKVYKDHAAKVEQLKAKYGQDVVWHTAADVVGSGIPALFVDAVLSDEQQDLLIADQDARQAIKSQKEQYPAWRRWLSRGKTKAQAYAILGQSRRTEFEDCLALEEFGGKEGANLVPKWIDGAVTDAQLKAVAKALREDKKQAPMASASNWANYQQAITQALAPADTSGFKVTPSVVSDLAAALKEHNPLAMRLLLLSQGKMPQGTGLVAITAAEFDRLKKWATSGAEPKTEVKQSEPPKTESK